ncbi:MAG: hypothetical protein PSN34_01245 [Urechidicola sp.]|nr:hypothetical protein [Urechidicola sp.]
MSASFALNRDTDNADQNVVSAPQQDTSNNTDQNLDETLSKKIALSLLHAVSGEDVLEVLKGHKDLFDNPDNWQFNAKWKTAGNQQSNPVGAFTELVINSMDACLIKKAKQSGIEDLRGDDVPQSMQEAVGRFYPDINEGKIQNLDKGHQNKIADESIFIGIKRALGSKKYPTYTIVDFGEGQKPEDFKDTFVSVEDSKNNKEGIPFVQGKFHMGSTGVFRFLTQGDFKKGRCKLIISKHFDSDKWAWTLARLREAKKDNKNESMPIVEYFSPDKNSVPYFYAESIQALAHKGIESEALTELNAQKAGVIKQGTIVKLYEFAMGDSEFRKPVGGLDNALTISLMRCALPIRTYELDAPVSNHANLTKLEKLGVHKRTSFSGAIHYLYENKTELVEGFPIAIQNIGSPILGTINVNVYAVAKEKDGKIEVLKDFLKKQNKRIFYTINGQVHATENKSVINSKLQLGILEDHLIIEVVCDNIDKSQKHEIFLTDRERMSDTEISNILKKTVRKALNKNKKLKELARILNLRKAKEYSETDESAKLVIQDMVNQNPEIGHLFGAGQDVKVIHAPKPVLPNYQGELFPTIFECQRNGIVKIPINSSKRVLIKTDVVNDYLSRLKDTGSFDYDNKNISISNTNLKNGEFTITVNPWDNAKIGDQQTCVFSFSDCQNVEPLSCSIDMIIVEAKNNPQPTPPSPKEPKIKTPDIHLVKKEDQDFSDESGAKVIEGQEGITIYVNRNNKYLESILEREPEDRKQYYETAFKNAVGIQTFALYNELKGNEDNNYEQASIAIAMSMIAVIKETGREICKY